MTNNAENSKYDTVKLTEEEASQVTGGGIRKGGQPSEPTVSPYEQPSPQSQDPGYTYHGGIRKRRKKQ